MPTFKKILVPIDFGDPSKHALDLAIDLAKQSDGSLILVHTWEIPKYAYTGMELSVVDLLTPIQSAATDMLEKALSETRKRLPTTTAILKQGTAWVEILNTIENIKPDLVVMGTHGRRGVARALLGSVAEKIVRTSPVPVLTVNAKS